MPGLNQPRLDQPQREAAQVSPMSVPPPVRERKPYDMAGAINAILDAGTGIAATLIKDNQQRTEATYNAEAARIANTLTRADLNPQQNETMFDAANRWVDDQDKKFGGMPPQLRRRLSDAILPRVRSYAEQDNALKSRDLLDDMMEGLSAQMAGSQADFDAAQIGMGAARQLASNVGVSQNDLERTVYGKSMMGAAAKGDPAAAERAYSLYKTINPTHAEQVKQAAWDTLSTGIIADVRARANRIGMRGQPSEAVALRAEVDANKYLSKTDKKIAQNLADSAGDLATRRISADDATRIGAMFDAAEDVDSWKKAKIQLDAARGVLEAPAERVLDQQSRVIRDRLIKREYDRTAAAITPALHANVDPTNILQSALKRVDTIPFASDDERDVARTAMIQEVQESNYRYQAENIPAFATPEQIQAALPQYVQTLQKQVGSGALTNARASDLMRDMQRRSLSAVSKDNLAALREQAHAMFSAGDLSKWPDKVSYVDENGVPKVISKAQLIEPTLNEWVARERATMQAQGATPEQIFNRTVDLVRGTGLIYQPLKTRVNLEPGRLTPHDMAATMEKSKDGRAPKDISEACETFRMMKERGGLDWAESYVDSPTAKAFYASYTEARESPGPEGTDSHDNAVAKAVSRLVNARDYSTVAALNPDVVARKAAGVADRWGWSNIRNVRTIEIEIESRANQYMREGMGRDAALDKATTDVHETLKEHYIVDVFFPHSYGQISDQMRDAAGTLLDAWFSVHGEKEGVKRDELRIYPAGGSANEFQIKIVRDGVIRNVSSPTGRLNRDALNAMSRVRSQWAEEYKARARVSGVADRNTVVGPAKAAQAEIEAADTVVGVVGAQLRGAATSATGLIPAGVSRAEEAIDERARALMRDPDYAKAEQLHQEASRLIRRQTSGTLVGGARYSLGVFKAIYYKSLSTAIMVKATAKATLFGGGADEKAFVEDRAVDYERQRARMPRKVMP